MTQTGTRHIGPALNGIVGQTMTGSVTWQKGKMDNMSGGRLNYFYSSLMDHVGDFGDKELDNLVEDLANLFHDREWYLSGDTGVGSWRDARDKFKNKWFSEAGRESRITKYLSELENEVKESFGMSRERCSNCAHWHEIDDKKYGKCDYYTTCLMHRSENCKKFEDSFCSGEERKEE